VVPNPSGWLLATQRMTALPPKAAIRLPKRGHHDETDCGLPEDQHCDGTARCDSHDGFGARARGCAVHLSWTAGFEVAPTITKTFGLTRRLIGVLNRVADGSRHQGLSLHTVKMGYFAGVGGCPGGGSARTQFLAIALWRIASCCPLRFAICGAISSPDIDASGSPKNITPAVSLDLVLFCWLAATT
jgi:hypothetical protein